MSMPPQLLPKTVHDLQRGIDEGSHAGVQLYVSRHGETVADLALGMARPGHPMTTRTIVPWMSAGKPLTAVAFARLWERGGPGPEDRVAEILPEFAAQGKEEITFRHLLTHTAGIELLNLKWVGRPWAEVVEEICAAAPAPGTFPLGERAAYSPQAGWFILAEAVRRARNTESGGEPGPAPVAADPGAEFAAILREEVFDPVGMTDTSIGLSAEQWTEEEERLALLHETGPTIPGAPRLAPWDTAERAATVSPGGGVRGPVRELGRFYEMLLREGRTESGDTVLRPETIAALVAPHRVGLKDLTFQHRMDWGLGFILNSNHYGADTVPYGYGRHASPAAFGHGGMQSVTAYADPPHHLVVIALFNGLPGEARHSRRVRDFNTTLYEDLQIS